MNTWNLFFAQNWQQRFDFHFTVWDCFFQAYQNLFHEHTSVALQIFQLICFGIFIIFHVFKCQYQYSYEKEAVGFFLFELNFSLVLDLLLTGCYEIFNSVVLDLSRRLLLVHFILRRKPTASVSVGEKNINTARISMNS